MRDNNSSRGGFSRGGSSRGGRGGGGRAGGRGGRGGRGRGRGGAANGSNISHVLASVNSSSNSPSSAPYSKPQRRRRHNNDMDANQSVKLAKSRGGLDQQILNVYADDDQADMEEMELDDEDGDVRPVTKTIGGNKFKLSEVASSDDEEIDEDDAFNSDDEDRFAGFKFYGGPSDRKTKSSRRKRGGDSDSDAASAASESDGLSLDESDDNDSGSDSSDATDTEDFVDLSEMLGSNTVGSSDDDNNAEGAEPEQQEQLNRGKKRRMPESDSDSNDSADEDDSSDSGDESADDDSDNAMDKDFIRPDELPSSDDDGDSDDAMDTDGSDAGDDIGDLITKLLDAKKSKLDAEGGPRKKRKLAEERTEAYAEGEFALPSRSSGRLDLGTLVSALSEEKDLGKVKGQAIRLRADNEESKREAAPLPAREKARIERQAGYSTVAEEVDRYQLLVERNRNAANLHFDLVDERASQSTAAMVSDFKPTSTLDKAIASIVDDSQFDDNKTMGQMELPDHVLDKEEIARRQKELRWMRELAFRQELKAKRHAKIKSKSFRKILKKERERTKEEDLQRLLESDPDAAREHLIKLELDRAKARMTQKGKLKSKWTAMMARNGELAERSAGLSREQILDQIKEAEDLQKRIHGVGNDESDSDADTRKQGGDAVSGDDAASDDDDDLPTKGVFAMKFMQRAAEAEALRQANASRDDFDGSDAEEDQIVGRRIVGSGINPAGVVVGNDEPVIESALAEPALRSNGKQQRKQQGVPGPQVSAADITFTVNTGSDDGAEDNPWAAAGAGIDRSVTSSKLGKLQKKQQKHLATMAARADASEGKSKPVLDLDVVNTVVTAHHDSDDDSDADVDGARRAGTGKAVNSRVAFKQTDLVSMAFAGDDVVREFEEEKAQLEDAEAGKVVDSTLPGWGSWGGEGLKAKTNVVVKKIAGVDKDKRKDSGMGHVIISEKRQKKLTKYMATSIPHPYQSRAQYEAAMRQTIGKEWVTSESMNALTMPKITKAEGVLIKPLKFNKAEAESWGEKKKKARSENNKLAVKKQKKQQQQK